MRRKLFSACAIDRNTLYCVTHNNKIIKKIDVINGKTEYIDNLEECGLININNVDYLLFANNKLYLFDQSGRGIAEYSLTDKRVRYFELDYQSYLFWNYISGAIYENKLFIFPSFCDEVTKIELNSGLIKRKRILDFATNYAFNERYVYCDTDNKNCLPLKLFSCGCQVGKYMWIFSETQSFAICYDLSSEQSEIYYLPAYILGCIHAVYHGGIFYLLNLSGNIYSWNSNNNEIKLLFDNSGDCLYPQSLYIAVSNKRIWLIPFYGEQIYVINIDNGERQLYNNYPDDFSYNGENGWSRFYGYCEDKNNYYFAMHSSNYILIIDKSMGKERWVEPVDINLDQEAKYHMKKFKNSFSELGWGLEDFLRIPTDIYDKNKVKSENLTGDYIWKFMNK